jgi:hypothetical protein
MMLRSGLLLGWLVLAVAVGFSPMAQADSSAAGSTSSGGFLDNFVNNFSKNGIVSYLLWYTGPYTQALSGDVNINNGNIGGGEQMYFAHYLTVGYKFYDGNMVFKLSTLVAETIDDDTDKDPNAPNWLDFAQTYMTLDFPHALKSERYNTNLETYVRYYIPIDRDDHDGVNQGIINDTGHGMIRLYVNPTKTWFDGKLTLSGAFLGNIKLPSNSPSQRVARGLTPQNTGSPLITKFRRSTDAAAGFGSAYREDFYIYLDPTITYSISPTVDLGFEAASGYMEHTTAGSPHRWSQLNDPFNGAYFDPNVSWQATKKFNLEPYIAFGPVFRGIKMEQLGFLATYKFL